MITEWYYWAILGVVLVVSELIVPAFVLVWFGLGSLLVALGMVVIPDLNFVAQLLIWIVASVALVVLWFKVFKPHQHKSLAGRSSAQVIGEIGLLTHDVDQFQKGQVRFQMPVIGSDSWECIADEPIKNGARVKVVSVEGSILKVSKADV